MEVPDQIDAETIRGPHPVSLDCFGVGISLLSIDAASHPSPERPMGDGHCGPPHRPSDACLPESPLGSVNVVERRNDYNNERTEHRCHIP